MANPNYIFMTLLAEIEDGIGSVHWDIGYIFSLMSHMTKFWGNVPIQSQFSSYNMITKVISGASKDWRSAKKYERFLVITKTCFLLCDRYLTLDKKDFLKKINILPDFDHFSKKAIFFHTNSCMKMLNKPIVIMVYIFILRMNLNWSLITFQDWKLLNEVD